MGSHTWSGLKDRSGMHGLPDRSGLPERSALRGLPERSGLHGLPERSGLWSELRGLPDRTAWSRGLRGHRQDRDNRCTIVRLKTKLQISCCEKCIFSENNDQ